MLWIILFVLLKLIIYWLPFESLSSHPEAWAVKKWLIFNYWGLFLSVYGRCDKCHQMYDASCNETSDCRSLSGKQHYSAAKQQNLKPLYPSTTLELVETFFWSATCKEPAVSVYSSRSLWMAPVKEKTVQTAASVRKDSFRPSRFRGFKGLVCRQ